MQSTHGHGVEHTAADMKNGTAPVEGYKPNRLQTRLGHCTCRIIHATSDAIKGRIVIERSANSKNKRMSETQGGFVRHCACRTD